MDHSATNKPANTEQLSLTNSDLLNAKEEPGALSKLWSAAYENPGTTATIAAVALAGTALIASKGRISNLISGKPGVLLIEDTVPMGKAYAEALTANGHKVTWVTNIKSLNPLVGTTPAGGELAINTNRLKVAFVDGDLGKGVLTGPEIVGTLRSKNIFSIGTSTTADLNQAMLANGAEIASNKAAVFASLVGKRLDVRTAMKSPQPTQTALDTLQGTLGTTEAALRKRSEEILKKHFLGS